jgi:uncharacterized protein
MPKSQTEPAISGLEFNVAQLLKETTGASRSYEVDVESPSELDEDLTFVSPLTGHVRLLRTGPNILVTGRLKAIIQQTCARCLTTFARPVEIKLEEEYFPTLDIVTGMAITQPAEIEAANLIDEQHILDSSEVVRQEFLLVSDSILYCRPDCKGLCPHCGQDRNLGACSCEDEVVDPRWAGLKALSMED